MLERIRWLDPLVGVQGKTVFQEVDELVELARLGVRKVAGGSEEAGAEVAGRLDHRNGTDCRLRGIALAFCRNFLVAECEFEYRDMHPGCE